MYVDEAMQRRARTEVGKQESGAVMHSRRSYLQGKLGADPIAMVEISTQSRLGLQQQSSHIISISSTGESFWITMFFAEVEEGEQTP